MKIYRKDFDSNGKYSAINLFDGDGVLNNDYKDINNNLKFEFRKKKFFDAFGEIKEEYRDDDGNLSKFIAGNRKFFDKDGKPISTYFDGNKLKEEYRDEKEAKILFNEDFTLKEKFNDGSGNFKTPEEIEKFFDLKERNIKK